MHEKCIISNRTRRREKYTGFHSPFVSCHRLSFKREAYFLHFISSHHSKSRTLMRWAITFMFLSTSCQGSNILEEVGMNDKTLLTEEQKEKFMEIISKYEYHSKSLEAIEIIQRFSQCVNNLDNNEFKGWGWTSTTTSPTCVSVGQPCNRDGRNLSDVASHLSKVGSLFAEGEKGWGLSSHPPGWNSPPIGWSVVGWSPSSQSKTCCNQDMCTSGYCCTPTPAYSNHSVCTHDSHCCGYDKGKSICDTTTGICKIRLGANCTSSNQCINGNCNVTCCIPNGACQSSDSTCTADNHCCNGTCIDGKCNSKEGSTCCGASDCIPPATCTNNKCCISGDTACSASTVCCAGRCSSETMKCETCKGLGESCTVTLKADDCCQVGTPVRICFAGICRKPVTSGTCNAATDLCRPVFSTECKDDMCCSKSGYSCAVTGKCCTGPCFTKGEKTICDQ